MIHLKNEDQVPALVTKEGGGRPSVHDGTAGLGCGRAHAVSVAEVLTTAILLRPHPDRI